jgi:hypothetical protein
MVEDYVDSMRLPRDENEAKELLMSILPPMAGITLSMTTVVGFGF